MKRAWPVFLVFLAMGFGDVVGPLVSLVKETFGLSNFMAQLLPMMGFLMFGLLSVPMGLVQDRKGKKFVLIIGLLIALIGLLLPLLSGMYGKPIIKQEANDTLVLSGHTDSPADDILVSPATRDCVDDYGHIHIIGDMRVTHRDNSAFNDGQTTVPTGSILIPPNVIVRQGTGSVALSNSTNGTIHVVLGNVIDIDNGSKVLWDVPEEGVYNPGPGKFIPANRDNKPVAVTHEKPLTKYYIVLMSILLLCAGATLLQVCGNPVMRDVSSEGTFASNLSLAQSVKAIGSSMGFLVPPLVLKALGLDWSILFPIYAVILLVTFIACMPLKLETKRDPNSKPATLGSCFALLGGNTFILTMVLGIFFYVGAEVCLSSSVPLLMKEHFGLAKFGLWVSWSLFFLPILVGRFMGAAILRTLKPALFLKMTAVVALLGVLAIFSGIKVVMFTGIVLVGLGFANIFPLIFSIAVDAMPERSNEISGLMVTAIAGGAILPPVMGVVADKFGVVGGFAVPFVALVYILWLALAQAGKAAKA